MPVGSRVPKVPTDVAPLVVVPGLMPTVPGGGNDFEGDGAQGLWWYSGEQWCKVVVATVLGTC